MNFTSPKEIKELLLKHNAKPSRGLGQNFLIDNRVLEKIISAAKLTLHDTVLEVGPGIGTLTAELAKTAGKVVAVEKDARMVEILKETVAGYKNVEVIHADILKLNPKPYTLNPQYKVVANIPYYITSPVIRKLLESENPPEEIILMVQKEVAQRICSKPPNMSLLAVSVQFYAEPEIVSWVKKESFWPKPKVDSAIIKIKPKSQQLEVKGNVDSALFFTVVKAGFRQPRKQLVNNLAVLKDSNGVTLDKEKAAQWLSQNNIKPAQRAETLSVEDWLTLAQSSKKFLLHE